MHLIDQQLNLMIRGRFEEGWKISEELYKTTPDDIRALFNRGWFLLYQGDFQGGSQMLEAGRHLSVYGNKPLNTNKKLWAGESLKNKIIILNLEAGIGDHIIHVRFAQGFAERGAKVIVACDSFLHSIFKTVPGVYKCITLGEVAATYHDYWMPSFSAGWVLGYTYDTLPNQPYLFAKPESVSIWKNLIKTDKIKVGIRWSGNPKFEHQQFRIFPAELMIDLHKQFDHIQFYSLQRDNDVRELPDEIIDLQYSLISWDDTLAAIENLDLVITSCTSIAHAAAAMGKPTWVIVPLLPYHVWAYGDQHSPWYQTTTRVFRQTIFGEWQNTFEKVADALHERFPRNHDIAA